jgi:hypothetical protein
MSGAGREPPYLLTYFNSTRWSITTMPSIFHGEVVAGMWVRGIFGVRGG